MAFVVFQRKRYCSLRYRELLRSGYFGASTLVQLKPSRSFQENPEYNASVCSASEAEAGTERAAPELPSYICPRRPELGALAGETHDDHPLLPGAYLIPSEGRFSGDRRGGLPHHRISGACPGLWPLSDAPHEKANEPARRGYPCAARSGTRTGGRAL